MIGYPYILAEIAKKPTCIISWVAVYILTTIYSLIVEKLRHEKLHTHITQRVPVTTNNLKNNILLQCMTKLFIEPDKTF